MSSIPWTRRSSSVKPVRISNQQYALDLAAARQSRASRSVERPTKIPLRSSSQSMGRDKQSGGIQRSKSHMGGSGETPVHPGKITPSQSSGANKITPSASSNLSKKKMEFVKDTRKLQDKEFLKEALQLVQGYFQEKCPEVLINGTDVRPMTIKMFIAMVNHLFEELGIVDKGKEPVRFEVSTYEKELPYWMKKLNYPGLITKAWLQTVNVPQYWHHVVGLLSWLVKLVSTVSLFNMDEKLESAHGNNYWAIFYFRNSLSGYTSFNDGKDEEYKDLCTSVVQKFYELNGVDDDFIQDLEQDIEQLRQRLEDPNARADKDAFDEAEQRLRMEQSKHQKCIEDIAKKKDDMEETKAKTLKKQRNCMSIKHEMEATRKEIENLQKIISAQPISVTEVADITKKTDYLDKEIKCLENECEDYSQLIARYEFEAAGKRDKILQATHTFNRNIIQLEQFIPELKGFHIYMDPENEKIVEEMEKMVKSLEDLKMKYINRCEELKNAQRDFQNNIKRKEEQLKKFTETVSILKEENREKKAENEELERDFEKKEKDLKEESEKWCQELKLLQEKLKEFDTIREKKMEMEKKFEAHSRSLEYIKVLEKQFWAKVDERYKHVPHEIEKLLETVKRQDQQLRQDYEQLVDSLK